VAVAPSEVSVDVAVFAVVLGLRQQRSEEVDRQWTRDPCGGTTIVSALAAVAVHATPPVKGDDVLDIAEGARYE